MKIGNQKETEKIGYELADKAKPGMVIALIGDLGTGKTTLSKYIAKGLGVEETITSPTFTIVHEYKSGRIPFYHFDVYRLNGGEELEDLGYEEYFYGDGLCVVEWADKVLDFLPQDSKILHINYGEKEGERIYQWE